MEKCVRQEMKKKKEKKQQNGTCHSTNQNPSYLVKGLENRLAQIHFSHKYAGNKNHWGIIKSNINSNSGKYKLCAWHWRIRRNDFHSINLDTFYRTLQMCGFCLPSISFSIDCSHFILITILQLYKHTSTIGFWTVQRHRTHDDKIRYFFGVIEVGIWLNTTK